MKRLALIALALLLMSCSGDSNDEPAATATPSAAQRDAFVISSLDIDAPLAAKALDAGVALPSPDGARDVVMYDFRGARGVAGPMGGAPGEGGNIVLSGRSLSDVGCAPAEPPCNGVFGRLFHVEPGAEIEILWRGREHVYQVVAVCNVATGAFGEGMYTRTPQEQLTLLTGAGVLGPRGFSHVLVVIARRAPVTASEACPAGTNTGPNP